jgi:hypothetical protein
MRREVGQIEAVLFAMKQSAAFFLYLFPWDCDGLTQSKIIRAANYFLLPGGIHILINNCFQTGNQGPGRFGTLVFCERQGFLQEILRFLSHAQNYIPDRK